MNDFNLRLRAGLTWNGKDAAEDEVWTGTDSQWEEYAQLVDDEQERALEMEMDNMQTYG